MMNVVHIRDIYHYDEFAKGYGSVSSWSDSTFLNFRFNDNLHGIFSSAEK